MAVPRASRPGWPDFRRPAAVATTSRALLALLGAAAALAVVALVLAPRVVDGGAVQAELRRLVQEATGRELVVGGRIGLDLFPRLRLRLARVAVGGDRLAAGREAARAEADRVDLELAPLRLLAGDLVVRRVQLVRPRLTLAAPSPRGAPSAGGLGALAAPGFLAGLEVVRFIDGRVDRAAPGTGQGGGEGPALAVLEGVDGTIRRDALLGRLAVSLTGSRPSASPVELEAEVGEQAVLGGAPASLRFELVHGGGNDHARLGFRGFGALGAAAPRLQGQFDLEATSPSALLELASLAHPLRVPARPPRTAPILLDGEAEFAQGVLSLDAVTARFGASELELEARAELAAAPVRLAVGVEGGEIVADESALADLRSVLGLPWWTQRVDGRVEARLGSVRWRGRAARQVRADLAFGASGIRVERLTASLPGAADVSVTGSLRPEYDGPRFGGSVSLSAEDARATLAALGVATGALPEEGGLRALSLTSGLVVAPAGVSLRDFELRLDGSRVTGSAALVRGGTRPRLALSASADRLDLGAYLPRPAAVDGARLRERLTALDATVDLAVARAGLGGAWADDLRLRASLERGLLRVGELSAGDPAEARIELSGSGDLPVDSFQLAGELRAERPLRLLRALGLDPPPTAARLAPLSVSGTARGGRDATEVELKVAGAGLEARLGAVAGPWFRPGDEKGGLAGRASIELAAERPGEALRDLGLAAAGAEPALARPLRLSGRLRRAADAAYAAAFEAESGPSRIGGDLTLRRSGDAAVVAGWLGGPTVERDLVLAALRVAADATGTELPERPQAWLGRLPDLAVWPGPMPAGLDLDLELRAERLLGGPGPLASAGARLRAGGGGLGVERLRLPLAGGTLTGVATLDPQPGFGSLGLDLELAGADAGRLLAALGVEGAAAPAGELRLAARLAATGRTLPELVRGLDGEVELEVRGDASGGTAAPPLLGLGGRLRVARGVASTEPPGLGFAAPGTAGRLAAQLDLAAWVAVLEATLRPAGPPDGAKAVTRRFVGEPSRLRPVAPAGQPGPPPAAATAASAVGAVPAVR